MNLPAWAVKRLGREGIEFLRLPGLAHPIRVSDLGRVRTMWSIEKHANAYARAPYEVLKFPHNLLLNEGINALFTLICGDAETKFDNTNAYIGVGDSDTAAAAAQTGLQATTNKLYKGMESGYPQYGSGQKGVWRSKFLGNEANFPWREITVANGSSDSAKNLNRKVQEMGTKTSPAEWYATLEISLQ